MGTFLIFGRMLLALGTVLGLVYGLSRLARRFQRSERTVTGAPREARIDVVARRSLTKSSSISVVRVCDRTLVVGSTPNSVELLVELTEGDLLPNLEELSARAAHPSAQLIASPQTSPPRLRAIGARTNQAPPRTAGPQRTTTPTAWDALLTTLRERTVRH